MAYRQKTWSSPLSNIKKLRECRKISEAHLEKSKRENEKKVACGGGTNDCSFVCLLGLVKTQEGKKKERLHAARLYWATLQCI